MQVFCKTLTGKVITIEVPRVGATVAHLVLGIVREEGIPPGQMRLVFFGKQLPTGPDATGMGKPLSDYNMSEHATVHLVLRLLGC